MYGVLLAALLRCVLLIQIPSNATQAITMRN
ncbi:hypothetical protein Taro_030922, partial [Colocasia esculenta]|nr:hypothetical protein [Colocasia esculenta]